MAKIQPLLNHCKLFMKCVFVLSFYNALCTTDFSMHHYAGFLQIGSHIATFHLPL